MTSTTSKLRLVYDTLKADLKSLATADVKRKACEDAKYLASEISSGAALMLEDLVIDFLENTIKPDAVV